MRKAIFILLLFGLAFVVNAQSFNFLPDYNYSNVKFVPKTYLVDGIGTLLLTERNMQVYQSSSGQCYIIKKSSTGKESRKYLGWYFGLNEIEKVIQPGNDTIQDVILVTKQSGVDPMFDELTSNERLRNTIFYNKDTTKIWTWVITTTLTKVTLPDIIATQTRELHKTNK